MQPNPSNERPARVYRSAGRRQTAEQPDSGPMGRIIHADPRMKLIGAALLVLVLIVLFLIGYKVVVDSAARQAQNEALALVNNEKTRYPLYYRSVIEQNARRFSLEPSLIAAVMLCESSFDEKAESRVGARGLMQLMPPTAQWVSEKLKEQDTYSFDLMYTADANVRYGCWYLSYLQGRFDGDIKKMICAYHAGQGNVDAWLKNPDYSPDGVTLEVIPTDDTRAYYDRVYTAYGMYKKHYYPADSLPVQTLPTGHYSRL